MHYQHSILTRFFQNAFVIAIFGLFFSHALLGQGSFLIPNLAATADGTILSHNNYYINDDVLQKDLLLNEIDQSDPKVFHLFSHGTEGKLFIDEQWMTAQDITVWLNKNFSIQGKSHLNIYGCNFAKGEDGRIAVKYLEAALGISVAASDDITGIDGDWHLEVGSRANEIAPLNSYAYNLQPCTTITGSVASTCDSVQIMATPCYVNGNPLAGGSASTTDAFVIFKSTNFGESTPPDKHLSASQVGSVWGVAYKESTSQLFTSAFLKRHVGFGSEGPGAIYQIDPTSPSPAATLFVDLVDLGINVGTDPRSPTSGVVDNPNELPSNTNSPSWDVDAFAQVGKMSLGGLDVSSDGTKLYVVNLYERKLVVLDISGATPNLINSFSIPNPNCSNGDYRPWAVKCHNGKTYVGVVCTAQTSQQLDDLKATVFEFDGTTFCEVFSFDLDYPRGIAGGAAGQLIDPAEWLPWTDNFQSISATYDSSGTVIYPQPILSDIEFDTDGSMMVALMDRIGHQSGLVNYSPTFSNTNTFTGQSAGDILRIGNVNGVFQLENNGQINGVQAQAPNCWNPSGTPLSGNNNQQGPGGGEYYWSDNYAFNPCNTASMGIHQEIVFGGLSFIPGSGEVAMTAMDPTNSAGSGGVVWMNNTTGKRKINESSPYDYTQHGYLIYNPATAGSFGKAAGLGDLEVFCTSSCTPPSAITLTQTAPTCSGSTVQNNGKITLTAVTDADKFGVSTGATYSGTPNYAAATAIGTLPQDLQTAIPNTGGTYTIRFFNGAADCFKDTTVTVGPISCNNFPQVFACTDATVLIGDLLPAGGGQTVAFPFENGESEPDICNGPLTYGGEGISYCSATDKVYITKPGTNNVIVWDVITQMAIDSFNLTSGSPYDAALSPDCSYLYVATSGGVERVDLATLTTDFSRSDADIIALPMVEKGDAWGIDVNPITGEVYLTVGFLSWIPANGGVKQGSIVKLASDLQGAINVVVPNETQGVFMGLKFLSNGNFWTVWDEENGTDAESIRLYSAAGTLLQTIPMVIGGNPVMYSDPNDIAFGPDGNIYVTTYDQYCAVRYLDETSTWEVYLPLDPSGATGKNIEFVCGNILCLPTCVSPSGLTLSQTAATCTGGTSNNDGKIILTAVTDADKFGVSTGATYSGTPDYSAATAIGSLPQDLQTAIPNAGGTYTIRFFNGADDCYRDTTVTVAEVNCCQGTTNPICPGESYSLDAGLGLTNIQWYKDSQPILNATTQTYIVTEVGSYHFTADMVPSGCSATACCPSVFVQGVCLVCPPKVCLPVTVVRN